MRKCTPAARIIGMELGKMKEKIENQRGIRKTIPLYLRFAESANGTGRDIGFYTVNKEKEVCRAELG